MTRVLTDIDFDQIEVDRLYQWRYDHLRKAGYNKRNADKLAKAVLVDYRKACQMREQSDNEKLLISILL